MWTFSIGRSLSILASTWIFTVLRLATWLTVAVVYLGAVAVGAGFGWGVGHVGGSDTVHAATVWGGIAGFVLVTGGLWWLRDYLLYLLTAGHVAAMVLVLDGERLPSGAEQVRHALAVVRARFGEVSLLFVLDQLVKGAVRTTARLLDWLAWLVDAPGLSGLVRLVETVIRLSTTFVDELVLARQIRLASADPWTTARHGIVLYAQNARAIVPNAVWLMAIRWVLTGALFLLLVGPAAAVVWLVPGPTTAWSLIFAAILALALQRALIDPFCIASLLQVYFAETEGRIPDPAWDARLAEVSKEFRDLVDRGRQAFAG